MTNPDAAEQPKPRDANEEPSLSLRADASARLEQTSETTGHSSDSLRRKKAVKESIENELETGPLLGLLVRAKRTWRSNTAVEEDEKNERVVRRRMRTRLNVRIALLLSAALLGAVLWWVFSSYPTIEYSLATSEVLRESKEVPTTNPPFEEKANEANWNAHIHPPSGWSWDTTIRPRILDQSVGDAHWSGIVEFSPNEIITQSHMRDSGKAKGTIYATAFRVSSTGQEVKKGLMRWARMFLSLPTATSHFRLTLKYPDGSELAWEGSGIRENVEEKVEVRRDNASLLIVRTRLRQ